MEPKDRSPDQGFTLLGYILILLTILVLIGLVFGMMFWLFPVFLHLQAPMLAMVLSVFGGIAFFVGCAALLEKIGILVSKPSNNVEMIVPASSSTVLEVSETHNHS